MTMELFFRLLGSLALLIYGMKTMSDALQKMAGPSLRHIFSRRLLFFRYFYIVTRQIHYPHFFYRKNLHISRKCSNFAKE